MTKLSLSGDYWRALKVSLVIQIVLGFGSFVATDDGMVFHFWSLTMAAYWGGFILILVKRPKAPTKGDLFLIRWGFVPLLFVIPLLTVFIWRLRGLS